MERIKEPWERVAENERIRADVSAHEAVSEVFTDPEQRALFVQGLERLNGVSLGGRRLREILLRCKTYDFADTVQENAWVVAEESSSRTVRAYWMLPSLVNYPTERMTPPDLDFILTGPEIEEVSNIFSPLGFETRDLCAGNKVRIAEVKGKNGVATFALESKSWHTQPPWPKIGTIHAPLVIDGDQPSFRLNAGWGSVYVYPFVCPGMGLGELKNPMDARNVAAAGRALLWTFTIAAPDPDQIIENPEQGLEYKMLPLPPNPSALCKVVENLVPLLRKIRSGELPEDDYRSGIRDLSLALSVISENWEVLDAVRGGDGFYRQIYSAYMKGCFS